MCSPNPVSASASAVWICTSLGAALDVSSQHLGSEKGEHSKHS